MIRRRLSRIIDPFGLKHLVARQFRTNRSFEKSRQLDLMSLDHPDSLVAHGHAAIVDRLEHPEGRSTRSSAPTPAAEERPRRTHPRLIEPFGL